MKKKNSLAMIMGLSGFDGCVPLAAAAGLFKPENAFSLAVLFMAGPGAILVAALLDGTVKERMFAALLAGIIATLIVVISAGIGPKVLELVNMKMMRITGGIAVASIALLVMGIKIPEKIPIIIIISGFLMSLLWR